MSEMEWLDGDEDEAVAHVDEELPPVHFPVEDGSAVLAHDGYDVGEWHAALGDYGRLAERVQGATGRLVTAPALMRDLFWSFYKRAPEIAPPAPLTPAHGLNQQLVEQVMATVEWQQVRAAGTASDVVAASMATIGLAERTLAALPEALVQQVNELAELESGAQALWDRAEALAELAEQAQGDQAAQLYEQAQEARSAAEAARAEIEQGQEAVEQGVEAHADALRRAARAALSAVEAEIDEVQAVAAAFGGAGNSLGMRSEGGLGTREKIALAGELGRSRRLREIAALCGRMQRIALRVQRTKVQHPPDEVASITVGNDLAHLLPSEIALLADPALEELFFLKYAERSLLQYHLEGSEKQGQGPILVALDSSGSMQERIGGTTKEAWSKAVTLALLSIARLQKRDCAVLHFSGSASELRVWHFPRGQASYAEIVGCTEHFFGGGTVFEPWMEAVLDLVDQARYDRADVICVSDGLTTVADEVRAAWQARRQGRGMRAYGVLIGTREGAAVLAQITDAMLTLDNLQDDVPVLETIFSV